MAVRGSEFYLQVLIVSLVEERDTISRRRENSFP